MTQDLTIQNRQRALALDTRFLREIALGVMRNSFSIAEFDLGIYLVSSREMARLNETHLGHTGPTDVITFDYSDHATRNTQHAPGIHGEIFICAEVAVEQARRFRTTWQNELVRYVIHGILHLLGHDDLEPAARRRMKRVESRILTKTARRFPLRKLGCKSRLRPCTKAS